MSSREFNRDMDEYLVRKYQKKPLQKKKEPGLKEKIHGWKVFFFGESDVDLQSLDHEVTVIRNKEAPVKQWLKKKFAKKPQQQKEPEREEPSISQEEIEKTIKRHSIK
ncbi:MAG: hypothetical protein ACMXYF_05500 [Candidatus Woesearchaeota archaeon]